MRSCPVALEEASALRIKNDDSVCVCPRCVAAVAHVERALLWLHSALAAAVQRDVHAAGRGSRALSRHVNITGAREAAELLGRVAIGVLVEGEQARRVKRGAIRRRDERARVEVLQHGADSIVTAILHAADGGLAARVARHVRVDRGLAVLAWDAGNEDDLPRRIVDEGCEEGARGVHAAGKVDAVERAAVRVHARVAQVLEWRDAVGGGGGGRPRLQPRHLDYLRRLLAVIVGDSGARVVAAHAGRRPAARVEAYAAGPLGAGGLLRAQKLRLGAEARHGAAEGLAREGAAAEESLAEDDVQHGREVRAGRDAREAAAADDGEARQRRRGGRGAPRGRDE